MVIQAHFDNIRQILIKELDQAEFSIKIAIAWFTDKELFSKLIERAMANVIVEIIILDDNINNSSGISYESIESFNGKVWRITESETRSIMHNKFCIIDKTVITGSYNWSYKARMNHENITIVKENDVLIKQFENEFYRIIKYYFHVIDKCSQKNIEQFNQVAIYSDFKKSSLESELILLKIQALGLENERDYIKKQISDFKRIYDIKLGPLLLELLELKKHISEISHGKYFDQKITNDLLNSFKESYKINTNKAWRQLNSEESIELKALFRKATKLCHPDLVNDSERKNAEFIFNELKNLYDLNDIVGVKQIFKHLENGAFEKVGFEPTNFALRKLNSDVSAMKIKRDRLEKDIISLMQTETFITINNIVNMDDYFKFAISKVKSEIEQIKAQYAEILTKAQ